MADATQTNNAGAARVAAGVLWVLVLTALAYGVFNTGRSVVDLFGG